MLMAKPNTSTKESFTHTTQVRVTDLIEQIKTLDSQANEFAPELADRVWGMVRKQIDVAHDAWKKGAGNKYQQPLVKF